MAAIPNVTLLEALWANRDPETDVAGEMPAWPYPEIVDGYALPLEGPGLGIEPNEALDDEALAASKPFVPSLQVPRLRGPAEWVGWVGAGFLIAALPKGAGRHDGCRHSSFVGPTRLALLLLDS